MFGGKNCGFLRCFPSKQSIELARLPVPAAQGISLGLLSPTLQPLLAMPPLNYDVQMLLGETQW